MIQLIDSNENPAKCYIRIGWLTTQKIRMINTTRTIQTETTRLLSLASTDFLKEGMKDNITHGFVMMNPHWTIAKTKEMITKLLHKATTGTNTEL